MNLLLLLSLLIATTVLALPWRPWSTRESADAVPGGHSDLSDITILIPARNEAGVLAATLSGVATQGTDVRVVVIDDESTDGTAAIARSAGIKYLYIVEGTALPPGWSGKLWALEQGRQHVHTSLTLLLDADIVLAPGMLPVLRQKLLDEDLQLVSVMAHLGMVSTWERWLLPAFVYFFKLLYPFRLANDPRARIAAAAGGCILLRTETLANIGGFAALKDALIDDCTLAAAIKRTGGGTWLGLTHSAHSQRRYSFMEIWNMVARTAYTQLRYSPLLLLACTVLMGIYYLLPAAQIAFGDGSTRLLAVAACVLALLPYLPTLSYYRMPALWALLLPLTAALLLAMTWSSALRYYRGERSHWKGRRYPRAP